MNVEETQAAVDAVTWYHTIDLGHGITTPGSDHTPARMGLLGLPADLSGRSVLDIGAWDGAFSFEAERRGASRVMAVDTFCWSGEGWGTKVGFETARRILNSKVEDREVEVLNLSPETVGVFDLVLCLGRAVSHATPAAGAGADRQRVRQPPHPVDADRSGTH